MSPDPKQIHASVQGDMLREHRDLMTSLTALSKRASTPLRDEAGWAAMHESLSELRDALAKHFRFEEEGPFGQEFASAFPRLAGRLDELLSEHATLLERADDLLRRTQAATEDGAAVCTDVEQLAGALRAHEAGENQLVLDAQLQDLGGGD